MRDAKRPRLHTSGDHRPIVALSAVTGQRLRLAASGVGELRMDWDVGTLVGAKGLATLARFAWLMGASDHWRTKGRTFDQLCHAVDSHLLERVLPKCEPSHAYLPDVTARGWRPDLGLQPPSRGRERRFTMWLTNVAVEGALYQPRCWTDDLTSAIEVQSTRHAMAHPVWPRSEHEWMKAMARARTRKALACADLGRALDGRATSIQRAWRDRAYAPPSGCMYRRDLAGAGGVVGA